MDDLGRKLLDELLRTPSPSGREQDIQRLIASRMSDVAETIEPDVHGNLILGINTSAPRRVLLDGHCDQIGFSVRSIDSDGYLTVDTLGGIDESVLLGERITIHADSGPLLGVFGKKPVHLQKSKETAEVPEPTSMWIDAGFSSREDAEKIVALGDYVTFSLHVNELRNSRIQSPGLDNKAGLWVVLETLRRCAKEKLNVALYAVSSVQEELGARGALTAATKLSPDVGITVDVTHATDFPTSDKTSVPCLLGGGPAISRGPSTNPVVGRMLLDAAKRLKIPHQISPSAGLAPNDSKSVQIADSGVAAGDLGIPQRNMHTQAEVCSLDDLEHTVAMLVEFVKSIGPETDFRPFNAKSD
jgi:putative aminopeptidase FrvX